LAQRLLESSSDHNYIKFVTRLLQNTPVWLMMVHFFTHRLARVGLVFILRAQTLMLAFDSTCMFAVKSHTGRVCKSQKSVSTALTASA
jgi:hypothetical protein